MIIYSFILLSSELPVYFYLTVLVYSLLIKAALYETVLHSLCCVLLNSELHQINVGHVVAQLVEALHYKLEGCGFDSWWRPCNFTLTSSFWLHYGPGFNSASNRTGKCGQCIWLTILPPSCANCIEIWEPQPTATLRACPVTALSFQINHQINVTRRQKSTEIKYITVFCSKSFSLHI